MKHAIRHLHFVGIGGSGMSPIAEILHREGYRVSGSDQAASAVTERLAALGLTVHRGHAAGHIGGADVVVTSTAVKADNPEVMAARAAGLPVVARATVLAELMRTRDGIAIAGTHGKTTTTSLVASVLIEAGADPSFVIGGQLLAAGANARLGRGRAIVVEADESDASFLQLPAVAAVVTNIDADHMDTYGHDLGRLHQAFVDFLQRLPFWGTAVVCADDPGVRAILPRVQRRVLRYGLEPGVDLQAVDVQARSGGGMTFTARQAGHADLPVALNLSGPHNVRNALAALGVARVMGLDGAAVQRALAGFGGVGRRFESRGLLHTADGGQARLYDDYGHHPAELAAVIAAARGAFPQQRLVLAFQPHRYTRTRDCLADFARVLASADALVLTEVYGAGESPIAGADGAALAQAVQSQPGAPAALVYEPALDALPARLQALLQDGDVLVTLGAGSIGGLPRRLQQTMNEELRA